MKTTRKPAISKLVARFDNELKNILMQDLQAVKTAKNKLMETIQQSVQSNRLSAA